MIQFSVSPTPARIRAALQDLVRRMRSLRPAYVAIAEDYQASAARDFGRDVAPLSSAYADWKARHYPGRSLLVRTGRLKASVSKLTQQVSDTTLRLTLDDPVARYHQGGTRRMPARPVLAFTAADRARAAQLLNKHVESAAAAAAASLSA